MPSLYRHCRRAGPVLRAAASAILCLSLAACGGGGGGGGGGSAAQISGTVTFPDGTTPVSGGTVYIADGSASGATVSGIETVARMAGAITDCPEPAVAYSSYTCTQEDGTFSLDSEVDTGTVDVTVTKGAFTLEKRRPWTWTAPPTWAPSRCPAIPPPAPPGSRW